MNKQPTAILTAFCSVLDLRDRLVTFARVCKEWRNVARIPTSWLDKEGYTEALQRKLRLGSPPDRPVACLTTLCNVYNFRPVKIELGIETTRAEIALLIKSNGALCQNLSIERFGETGFSEQLLGFEAVTNVSLALFSVGTNLEVPYHFAFPHARSLKLTLATGVQSRHMSSFLVQHIGRFCPLLRTLEFPQDVELRDNAIGYIKDLQHLTDLQLPDSISDAAMPYLANFKLTRLRVGPRVTHKGLSLLSRSITQLQTVNAVSDAELHTVGVQWPNLLSFSAAVEAKVTPDGYKALSYLKNVEILSLQGKLPTPDYALSAISGLPKLVDLTITCTPKRGHASPVTDTGIAVLSKGDCAKSLRFLSLEHVAITDRAVQDLSTQFPALESLIIGDAPALTSSCLALLSNAPASLRVLSLLDLSSAAAEAKAIEALKTARPGTKVYVSAAPPPRTSRILPIVHPIPVNLPDLDIPDLVGSDIEDINADQDSEDEDFDAWANQRRIQLGLPPLPQLLPQTGAGNNNNPQTVANAGQGRGQLPYMPLTGSTISRRLPFYR